MRILLEILFFYVFSTLTSIASELPVAIELPGKNNLKNSPGIVISSEGIDFSTKGMLIFPQSFELEAGSIEFIAAFHPEPVKSGEMRKINYLLCFTGSSRTIAALTLNQYPKKDKMLLTYSVSTTEGEYISCGAEYFFESGKFYHISATWNNGRLSIAVDNKILKTISYSAKLKCAERLVLGCPGAYPAMPMTLKSFSLRCRTPEKCHSRIFSGRLKDWHTIGKNIHVRELPGEKLEVNFDGGSYATLIANEPVFLADGDNHIRTFGSYRVEKSEYGSMFMPRMNSSMPIPVLVMSGDRCLKPTNQYKSVDLSDRFDFSIAGKTGEPYAVNFLFYGNPVTVILEKVSVTSAKIFREGRPMPTPENREFNPAEVESSLAAMMPVQAEIRRGVNRSELILDGKPIPPAIYRRGPHYPQWSRYKEFGEAGINIYMFFAHFGKPSETHKMNIGNLWLGRDRYDFSKLGHELRTIHAINPNARVILVVSIEPYEGWSKDFPDATFTNARGEKGRGLTTAKIVLYGKSADKEHEKHLNEELFDVPSNYGTEYLEETTKAISALTEYLDVDNSGKIVCGIHIIGGADGQFFPYDRDVTRGEDHSPSAMRAWRKWLRKKYDNNLVQFRTAWNDPNADFDNAQVPGTLERGRDNSGRQPTLRGRDYMLFCSEALTDLRIALCRAIKENSRHRLLAGTYYPTGWGGNYHIGKMLDSTDVDFLIDIRHASINGSFLLRNKLYIGELDLRVPDIMMPIGNYTFDNQMFESVVRRSAANVVQREGGMFHLFDIGECYYSNPATIKFFGKVQRELLAALDSRIGITPEIGVYQDPAAFAGYSFRECSHLLNLVFHYSVSHVLDHSGIPYQLWLVDDLFRSDVQLPKILFFPIVPELTPKQLSTLRTKAKAAKSIIVWGYYRPFQAGKTSTVAGFEYHYPSYGRPVSIATGKSFTDKLAGKVLGESYTGLTYSSVFQMDYEIPASITPRPGDTILARYAATDIVSMLAREVDGVTEIANGAPGAFSPEFFRNLARVTGAQILSENDNLIVSAESGLLTIVCERGGKIEVKIPAGQEVVSSPTGHSFTRDGNLLRFTVPNDGEIAFFKLVPQ